LASDDRKINELGADGGMELAGETEVLGGKSAPVQLYSPQKSLSMCVLPWNLIEYYRLWKTLYSIGRKSTILLQSSQAPPVRPTDNGSVKVKALDWLEVEASGRGRGILILCLNGELHDLIMNVFYVLI
jgi:hypothetical protein